MNFNGTLNLAAEDRPIDALLAAYAAKTLSAPLAALVAAHLELKPDNRAYVVALEAAHGIFLEELKPVPLAGRDRRLVNIFAAATPDAAPVVTRLPDDTAAVLPRALRRLAGCDDAGLPWRRRSAGLKEATQGDGGVARFICLQPGKRLPALAGDSPAVALVITGALAGRTGYHEHGDIVFAGRDDEVVAEGDVDCLCFVATEDAAKPSGALSRLLRRVMGG